MEDEDAYQIMPYKEIVALRKDIESLKTSTDDSSYKSLLNSMSSLTKSMMIPRINEPAHIRVSRDRFR